MKRQMRILAVMLMALITIPMTAASKGDDKAPCITFANKAYDFGTVKDRGGDVVAEYEFTNTGDAPLMIISVNTNCGCTMSEYPKEPIAPGAKSKIKLTFNPIGYRGEVLKNTTLRTNDKKNRKVVLKLTGVVVPQ